MDLQMPDGGGLNATKELRKSSPNIRILVVTRFEGDESIFTALRAGARGVSNAAIADQLTISVKTVRNHVSNIYNKL